MKPVLRVHSNSRPIRRGQWGLHFICNTAPGPSGLVGPHRRGPVRFSTVLAFSNFFFLSGYAIDGVRFAAPELHADQTNFLKLVSSPRDIRVRADHSRPVRHFAMPSSTAPKLGARHREPVSEPTLSDEAESESAGSRAGLDSDSDSLDSSEPRKRRRTSPEAVLESDDGEESDSEPVGGAKAMLSFSAPSRIKRGPVEKGKPGVPEKPGEQLHNPPAQVLAPTDPNTSFESLNLRPWLVRSLANMAIKRPTGIQKGCIPEILKGKDCIGGSRTGSGKTVAFAAPILQKWAEDPSGIFAVVLTPTRYAFIHRRSKSSMMY